METPAFIDLNNLARQSDARKSRYLTLLELFVTAARQEGLTVEPYRKGALHFSALTPDAQLSVLSHFASYVEVCQEVQNRWGTLLDEKRFLWRMLIKLRLTPPSDLMERIEKDQIIEIYDGRDLVQVFRSMNFYEVCGYSIDDVLCRPWPRLYKRDEAITQQILQKCSEVLAPNGPEYLAYRLPLHVIEEIDSDERLTWLMDICFCNRLRNETGSSSHFLNVNRAVKFIPPESGR